MRNNKLVNDDRIYCYILSKIQLRIVLSWRGYEAKHLSIPPQAVLLVSVYVPDLADNIIWPVEWIYYCYGHRRKSCAFPVGKESAVNVGDPGSIPGLGRSAGERIGYPLQYSWASLVAQIVKNLPAVRETWVQSLGWEDPQEKGKATHSSILAWKIPWTVTKSRTWLRDFHLLTLVFSIF